MDPQLAGNSQANPQRSRDDGTLRLKQRFAPSDKLWDDERTGASMAVAARAHAGMPRSPRWLVSLRWSLRAAGLLLFAAALWVTPELVAQTLHPGQPLTETGVTSLLAYRVISLFAGALVLALAELLPKLAANPELLLGPLCGLLPLVVLATCVALKLALGAQHVAYTAMVREDGPVEYATSAAYFAAGWIAVIVGRGLLRRDERLLGVLWLGLAVALVLVGFEEISWGQRVLDVPTPELLASNVQNEMNLHNLPWAQRGLHGAYVVVGLFGALAWAAVPARSSPRVRELAAWLVPAGVLFSFFLPVALFYLVFDLTPRAFIGSDSLRFGFVSSFDQEPVEMLLAFGFLAFTLHAWARLHGWVRDVAQPGSPSAPGRRRISPR